MENHESLRKRKGIEAVRATFEKRILRKRKRIRDFGICEDGYLIRIQSEGKSRSIDKFYETIDSLNFRGYCINETSYRELEVDLCVMPITEATINEFLLNYIEAFCLDAPASEALAMGVSALETMFESATEDQRKVFDAYVKKTIQ